MHHKAKGLWLTQPFVATIATHYVRMYIFLLWMIYITTSFINTAACYVLLYGHENFTVLRLVAEL